MFLLDSESAGAAQDLVFSASDLVIASTCEYQLLRVLDEKLHRSPKAEFDADEMLGRAAKLGDIHEHAVLERFVAEFGAWDPRAGTGVYDVVPAEAMDRATLRAKHAESIEALRSGADVVFQAAFFDGGFHGRSDFLVKQGGGRRPGGTYAVFDTKLARHAKVTALLQLAAYAEQLLKAGIEPAPELTLVLGATVQADTGGYDYVHSNHKLADVLPVFRERRSRFLALTSAHRSQPEPVQWGTSGVTACGRCNYCKEQVESHRDLLMVAGMRITRRKKLLADGISTIDDLAGMPDATDSVTRRLQEQARLQTGIATADGTVRYTDKTGKAKSISYSVLESNSLARLPRPDAGDIFFDFEGDPLWQDPATGRWGLEYLFGVVENPGTPGEKPVFRPFWAHSRTEERQAFIDFLDYVEERRMKYPDMRIYHYAAYEKTALRHLSLIHTVGEAAVDNLLRDGVLVDLYDTVRHSIRISENSYSIKKLEPLYMGEHLRSGEVTDAGASVVAYANYCTARDEGRSDEAAGILAGISDYNEYDCLSTLELRNWLLGLASERSIEPGYSVPATHKETEPAKYEAAPEETALLDYVAEHAVAPSEARAVALVAAAVGYHRREDKQYWWGHFDRLDRPVSEWEDTRDCFVVEQAEVVRDWSTLPGKRNPSRDVLFYGRAAEGSGFTPGNKFFRMYDAPVPEAFDGKAMSAQGRSGAGGTEILDASGLDAKDSPGEGHSGDTVLVREILPSKTSPFHQLPMALTPDVPVNTNGQRAALSELAVELRSSLPSWPKNPALDLLRRVPPRLATPTALPVVGPGENGYVDAITAAVADLDRSYLAVQGPPGTGKTYVGSHVVARLVAAGWKVGVVAQSHTTVEALLRRAIEAGVSPARVGKKPKEGDTQAKPWEILADGEIERLLTSAGGCLIGGTAWTMTGKTVPARSLDLLVIDEAGQFSLANTLAVSRATNRLLLLGDPQQLPQVTQGKHPEPVDESALGWLANGHHTLPEELGYFLATSWRMHPDLCTAVSELSYDNRLESAPLASERRLAGVPAGVECVYVPHGGNSTQSSEEAAEVARQVRRHVGLAWLDPRESAEERPLGEKDILVVAAYNAQVQLIQRELRGAGLGGVRVGTVDKFQGQEAPVVIVSMAASAAAEVPRGMDFLLSRNRINVAISRGQWRAVVVRSPELTNYLPSHPEGLEQLGGFVALCQRAS
ncbi:MULTISPECIES: bifunctional RecB family nuclease/DEAD/DEAH box helicase [Arthrobacter]|uniref:TM0106 family RecB-like putative nuclease n=1 Tax=Arthrobacter terricola TaxID=2547396 RepID=A0A4R5KL95_9MICC|nr:MULTISPECIES: bifunctional RecB family nuclease/DEAD/DEAH box helicase [Arthrobacter]MBT8161670.1 TM0106 family RecB-like putative nuclease [Arthrobacter sp. GN70]TDF95327.1 TM0106 family RecB-like putative nuclease [Arthrobacter terricola]